jgi:hypothetical protein
MSSIAAEVVSNSIKNGILFILIILIVHFAVKSTVEHKAPRTSKERFQSSSSSSSSSLKPISDANDADLLDYVFGGVSTVASNIASTDNVAAPAPAAIAKTPLPPLEEIPKTPLDNPAPPPLPESTGMASEGLTENGFYVVNKFQNENVMCGGSLYPDAPELQGFDGVSIPYSW